MNAEDCWQTVEQNVTWSTPIESPFGGAMPYYQKHLVDAARAATEEVHRQEVSRLEGELQTKSAVEAWPRVAELSNEVIGLKAEVERLTAENARLMAGNQNEAI